MVASRNRQFLILLISMSLLLGGLFGSIYLEGARTWVLGTLGFIACNIGIGFILYIEEEDGE